jgi:hypothetical protein
VRALGLLDEVFLSKTLLSDYLYFADLSISLSEFKTVGLTGVRDD